MAVCPIRKMGDPCLYRACVSVQDINSHDIKQLITNMWDTVYAISGTGIAAPQLGANWRIMIFGVKTPRYDDSGSVPTTLLVNPELTVLDYRKILGWEGCLSVPGLRGLVPRYQAVHYRGYDEKGLLIEREANGFHARVVQHEFDHLDGVLFPERMENLDSLGFEDELGFTELINRRKGDTLRDKMKIEAV